MTTIVYKDGWLVADSMAWFGWATSPGQKCKIWRDDAGDLWGVSSSVVGADADIRSYLNDKVWLSGAPPESFEIIRVQQDGKAYLAKDRMAMTGPIIAPYFAIGSGDHYALAALRMGADAFEAVRVASHLDKHTAAPFYACRHDLPYRVCIKPH